MLALGISGMVFGIFKRKISFSLPVCSIDYLYGTVIFFSLALSLYGILQYSGLVSSGNNNFAIIGTFDNPAGYAAALSCAFPLCLFFVNHQKKYLRYTAKSVIAVMAVAVILSGSRAGMLAITIATVVWLLIKSKIDLKKKSKIALAVVIIVLTVVSYFFKKDSADGRLLIWRCTLDMVADKPILGHGHGAFQAKYMLYQAAYLNANPNSRYAPLADNVLRPFNEYLLILAEHGIVGLSVLILSAYLLLRAYRRKRSDEKLAALMSLLALSVFSFFSYPFRYPFTLMMLFLNMTIIIKNQKPLTSKVTKDLHQEHKRFISHICALGDCFVYFVVKKYTLTRIVVFLLSAGLLSYTVMLTRAEIKWNRIAQLSLAGHTVRVLPEYDKLYRWLGNDGLFLYNHAAELNEAKEYERSITAFEICTRHYNDMDVQMLMADNYKTLGKYAEAERHFKMAAAMCPVRFMPLYELVKLYDTTNQKDEALAMAKIIIEKDVKIPSPTIAAIKNEMQRLIEAQEINRVKEDLTDEPVFEKTRQGETPEQGEALPP